MITMASETDKWGWKHVSVFGGFDRGSGTKRWKCNHCNLRYNGSYSRVRAHLLGFTGVGVKSCPAIDKSLREELRILEEERLLKKKNNPIGPKIGKRIKNPQMSFCCPVRSLAKEDVDEIVARFFYADGLNMNIVNSPYFREMVRAIAAYGPGYDAPSKEMLCDTFISKEKAKLEKAIALVRESWPNTGCTIICVNSVDGSLGCLCINLFISSPRGVLFLKSIDINEGDEADGLFINVLSDVIIDVGPRNVLQIITHLGQASSAFETVILSKFSRIFWSQCTSHSIHVLMEEIAELDWMKAVVLCATGIEQVISSDQRSPSCVLYYSNQCSDAHSMRFAPSYCKVLNIFQMREALQDLVMSSEWRQWKVNAPEDLVSTEATVLGDEFWSRAQLMLQLCEPFVRLLSTFNIDKSIMGDVYNWRVQSLEAVRSMGIDDIALNQMELLIESRWDVLFSPLHATGYMLNPRYFGRDQSKDKTLMRGWKATLDRYEPEGAARRLLREQLSIYWRLEGSFGEEDAVECRDKMDPVAWWENFGFETPHLQTLAIKVLSQVSSVSLCRDTGPCDSLPCRENVRRMGVERIEDLVFVRNNLSLLNLRSGNVNCSSLSRTENSCGLSGCTR